MIFWLNIYFGVDIEVGREVVSDLAMVRFFCRFRFVDFVCEEKVWVFGFFFTL